MTNGERARIHPRREGFITALLIGLFTLEILLSKSIVMNKKGCQSLVTREPCWLEPYNDDVMMKFQQRLLLLGTACLMVITYMVFLSGVNFQGWIHHEHNSHIVIRDLHLRQLKYQSQAPDVSMCPAPEDRTVDTNLTTLTLQRSNNYQLVNGGQYILPNSIPGKAGSKDVEPLTVILMPHSHNDPGWLRTMEEYYVYTTKKILHNMVDKLRMYPNMSFVWAETVFLNLWWNELEDDVKVQVRRLVRNGQLEIVSGGWVMPDEASSSYYAVIDQLMEGHQWLIENIHVKPRNSWSIDPFGHSGAMPYFWKKSGLDNMVIQRIHQATKGSLVRHGGLEFMWRQQWDKQGKCDILCHVMPYMLYNVKHTCGPNPYICMQFDFRPQKKKKKILAEPISLKNVEIQANFLYEQYRRKANLYKYNVILVPLGDDFRYDSAEEWDQQFHNYNMLARYMNSHPKWKINVKFGTLKDYFDILKAKEKLAVKENAGMMFPSLSGDFYPYSDKDNAYWTGYFTTRPFDKRFSREVEAYLRSADILNILAYAMASRQNIQYESYHEVNHFLQQSRRHLGLFLHHDAITGTSKEYVVQDFENKLYYAYNASQKVVNTLTQFLLTRGKLTSPEIFQSPLARLTSTSVTIQQTIVVTYDGVQVVLFNPAGKNRREIITLLVDTDRIIIKNSNREHIPFQLNPVWESAASISQTKFEVAFLADLEPLSLSSYYLHRASHEPKLMYPAKVTIYNSLEFASPPDLKFSFEKPRYSGNFKEDIVIESETLSASFNSRSGMLKHIDDKVSGNTTHAELLFMKYKSQGSGAYIFYPSGEATAFLKGVPIIHVVEGPFLTSIEVLYEYLQHSVTLFNVNSEQGQGLHIRNRVNMHANNLRNLKDMEIIMRVTSDIKNPNLEYFTDQNGFQLIKRRTDPKHYVEANYYPITTMLQLEDNQRRITLHAGQPHGVASLSQGQFEVMLDRELLRDDDRGLNEGVGDNKVTDSFFVLQVEYRNKDYTEGTQPDIAFPSLLSQHINDNLQQPVIPSYTTIASDILYPHHQPIKTPLPCDLHIVSFKNLVNSDLQYTNSSLILHKRGFSCDFPTFGIQCHIHRKISFSNFFKENVFSNIRTTTLTHMYSLSELSPSSELSISTHELGSYTASIP